MDQKGSNRAHLVQGEPGAKESFLAGGDIRPHFWPGRASWDCEWRPKGKVIKQVCLMRSMDEPKALGPGKIGPEGAKRQLLPPLCVRIE